MTPKAKAIISVQRAFDLFLKEGLIQRKIYVNPMVIGFQPVWWSTTWNANTILFAHGTIRKFRLPSLDIWTADLVLHEAWHVVQARTELAHDRGWKTRKWVAYYLPRKERLEREARDVARWLRDSLH